MYLALWVPNGKICSMNLVLYRLVILSSNNVHSLTESNHGTTLRALLLGRTCYAYWINVVSSTYCYQQSFQPTFFSFLLKRPGRNRGEGNQSPLQSDSYLGRSFLAYL